MLSNSQDFKILTKIFSAVFLPPKEKSEAQMPRKGVRFLLLLSKKPRAVKPKEVHRSLISVPP